MGDTVLLVSLAAAVSGPEGDTEHLGCPAELELILQEVLSKITQWTFVKSTYATLDYHISCCKIDLYRFCGFWMFSKLWHPVIICLC